MSETKLICTDCKFKKSGYCGFYNIKIATLNYPETCTAYKKKSTRITTNTIKKKSIKQEKKLAKDWGANRTPQSGAKATSPADMVKGNYVIESKATEGKSISLQHAWLSTLKETPVYFGKIPVLVLEFKKFKDRYVIMDEQDFNKIKGE